MQRKLLTLSLATAMATAICPQISVAFAQAPAATPAPDAPVSTDMRITPDLRITPQPGSRIVVDPPDYANGLKAMDEGRWADALKSFDKLAAERKDYVESALFWRAYNLEKLGRASDASATCGQLASAYPNSSWNGECAALRVEMNVNLSKLKVKVAELKANDLLANADQMRENADAVRETERETRDSTRQLYRDMAEEYGPYGKKGSQTPHDPNDDLKLLALNSLMQQEPEKAMPVLRTFILSDKPIELRRRALFVLGESKAPGAQELLMEVATKSTDPQLQRAAVQTLATTRGKKAAPDLVKIYQGSSDHEVKRAAVSGLFLAQDAADLVELSRAKKDMDMKRDIVTQLALMHDPAATAYMEELLK